MNLSINDAIREGSGTLREAMVADPRREAASLLAHVFERDRTFLLAHPDELLTGEQVQKFHSFVVRRAAGEPQQYITGHQEFFKLDFEVTPNVLIPRPETEAIVEVTLELLKDNVSPFVADIGTGSACIIVSFLHERSDARAIATDISIEALQVARRNAQRHSVSDRLELVQSDLFSAVDAGSRFSLIASNPPYIPESDWLSLPREVREYEPRFALVSGADGLADIRRLLQGAPSFLDSHGYLVFEIGIAQERNVRNLIDLNTWHVLEIRQDLQGIPRTVVLQKK